MLDPKDIAYEYPDKDNTKGEHMRFVCDATHVPTGLRARGRGSSSEVAKQAAIARLRLELSLGRAEGVDDG